MADVRAEGPAVERGEKILTPEALADECPDFLTPAYELID
jgi:hypothetical protein